MNQDRLAGICMQFKGRLMEGWGNLSRQPWTAAAGRRDQLAGRVREQRGFVKEATEIALRNFRSRNRNWRNLSH